MSIHYSVVLKVTGILMMVIGISMLPSFLVSAVYDDPNVAISFFIVVVAILFPGFGLVAVFHNIYAEFKLRDGFLVVTLCWLLASILGALPYMTSGVLPNFCDAFFESMSGFSTTGATVIDDVEALPQGILFWRSFTQWLGGIGILVFAIGLLPALGVSGQNVMTPETPNLSFGKITNKMSDNVKTLYLTYTIFTIAEALILKVCGLGWFDALVHTFSTVGTGGFSTYNDGIAHFASPSVNITIIVFMLICGINFNLYSASIKHGIRALFRDVELRFYMITIALGTAVITVFLHFTADDGTFENSFLDSLFQTVSIISTTGYTTADYATWPQVCVSLLFILMFIGGCSSSTSGGVKAIRILVVIRFIIHGIRNRLHPNSVAPITINGNSVPSNTVSSVTYHIFLYIVMMFGGAFLFSIDAGSLEECFTVVISCMGNIGTSFGEGSVITSFSQIHGISKLVLSVCMLAGRLELYTLFIICTPRFWNPNN